MSDHAELRCLSPDAIERAAVSPTTTDRAHVASCDACRREVDEARTMNAMLRDTLREAPAPATVEAVWRRLEQSRNVVPFTRTRSAPPPRLLAWASVAVAAAAVVVYVAAPAQKPTPSPGPVANVAAPPARVTAAPSATTRPAVVPAAPADAALEPRTPRRDGPEIAATRDGHSAPRLMHRDVERLAPPPSVATDADLDAKVAASAAPAPAREPAETIAVDTPEALADTRSDERLVDRDAHDARAREPHFDRPEPSRASASSAASSQELGTTASALVGTDTNARDGKTDLRGAADARQPLRVRHEPPLTLDRIDRRDEVRERHDDAHDRRDEQRDRRDEQRQRRNERQDRRRDERQGRPGGPQGR